MSSHRINVLGASGSGVSTLGRALSVALSVPYFESDDYFHEPSDPPYQSQRLPEERHALITRDLASDAGWILGGGVAGWLPYPQLSFTLIAFVWAPTDVRLKRLRGRERSKFGERILAGGDMHDAHREFTSWASRYDAGDVEGKTLARHQAYLASQSCPVVRLDGLEPTVDLVAKVVHAARQP